MATIETAGYRAASKEATKPIVDKSRQLFIKAYGPSGEAVFNSIVASIRGQMVEDR